MQPRPDANRPKSSRSDWTLDHTRGLSRNTVRVGDVMSKEVVTTAPDDTIFSVAQAMSAQTLSCVVVTQNDRVVGILTEKDMLNIVAGRNTDLHHLAVSERMSSPVETVAAGMSILEADRMMETKCIRRLPVVEDERLVGIVTQTDITHALISLNSLGCVSDIMTKQLATVSVDATAVEAARLMSSANISCLVAMHGETTAGIITEKDLLKRILALQKDPTQIRVLDVMSLPVVTVPPTCSILDASRKMESMHFHRILVADGKTVCGLVTQTDIMRAVRRSTEAVESQQSTVNSELADLLQRSIRDLQRVRDFLGGIPHPAADDDTATGIASPALEQLLSCGASLREES